MKKQVPYVQFSKKMVVSVCSAVTVITVVGIVLCYLSDDLDQAASITKIYIQYAMVVFVAYSGNSAIEKWLVYHCGNVNVSSVTTTTTTSTQSTSNTSSTTSTSDSDSDSAQEENG